jgi:hypothetical protein
MLQEKIGKIRSYVSLKNALLVVVAAQQKLGERMNKNLLRQSPKNLPVYVYHLQAYIALVHGAIAYKLRGYSFSNMRVVSNQPLRAGDVLNNNCCYYGNESIEIIPHICCKGLLGGAEIELRYYYGCQINQMAISYVECPSPGDSCGVGSCTVFIELSASALDDKIKALNNRYECLTKLQRDILEFLGIEYKASQNLDYWKKRIPDWDERLECIGEVPPNLF